MPQSPSTPSERGGSGGSGVTELGTLTIRIGEERHEFSITDASTAIGRAPDNALVLADPMVSRYHARLEFVDGRFVLVDLESANGTQINGVALTPKQPRQVRDGDTLKVGDYAMLLHVAGTTKPDLPEASQETTVVAAPQAIVPVGLSVPRLIVRTAHASREVALDRDLMTLGSGSAVDILIADSAVAAMQAVLRRGPDGIEITNAAGAGTLRYQDAPFEQKVLTDGDVLWIGSDVSLTYRTPADLPTNIPRIDLRGRAQISMGRATNNDVALVHPAISRQHAKLTRRDGEFDIEDLGSSNGTYVNGKRLASRKAIPLAVGDTLRLGPFKFFVTAEALEQSDESHDLRLDALHLNQPMPNGMNLLQDISLAILPRELVAIVGASGVGKSTLIGALTGTVPARRGAVLVNGSDLYHHYDAFRGHFGFVPQDDTLHTELSVAQVLDYEAQLRLPADTTRAERAQRVDEVLRTLGLSERREASIAQLNAGQRKRVSIGVELLAKPGLFFLDEPTAGLDPGTESQLMRLMRQLADAGHTMVLVTHATKNVMLCDMVAFMAAGGYMAFYGPPGEALSYFGVKDFDAIYEQLQSESTPEEWANRFSSSPQYAAYVSNRLTPKYGPEFAAPGAGAKTTDALPNMVASAGPRVSGLRQFSILSARHLHILARDRLSLIALLLIAPIIGSIDLLAWPRQILDPQAGDAARTMVMLFLAASGAFLAGALTTVREIVKEAPVYRRERTVVVQTMPYLFSKLWLALLFALYHAAALLLIKAIAVDLGSLSPADLLTMYLTLVLAAMSGALSGLMISALARREEQALLLAVGLIAIQTIFSGGLLPLDQLGPVGGLIGDLTSTKWAFQGLVAAVHVKSGDCAGATLANCRLPGLQALTSDPERRVMLTSLQHQYGDALNASVGTSWLAMLLIMAAIFVALVLWQRRKEPVR